MAKILIVDDRALNRKFLLTLLRYGGHQLSEAADGAEALMKIRAEHPDLVVTDLLMPTMDGFQLVQQMRTEPTIAATEVIFYTATYRLDEADELAKACGVSVVIPKPSTPELILNTVNAVLDKTRPPAHGPPALIPAKKDIPETQLESTLTNYVLNLKLLNAQMTELVHEGEDLAHREAAVLDMSEKLRHAMTELQAVSLKLASLLELGLELTAHRDPDELLNVFCRAAVSVIGARYGALGILSDDGQGLAYFKPHGAAQVNLAGIEPASPRAGVLGALLDEPRPRRERNADGDPRAFGFSPKHPLIHNFLGVAVVSSEQVYGWFYLADKLNGAEFGADDEQLASTLAAQLAVVYQAVRMYDEVQRHAAKLEIEAFRRKQAEEKFYSAIQGSPNGMLMVDGEGKITLVNTKIVELFGYEADELVGQPVEVLLPEHLRHPHADVRKQFMHAPQTRNMGTGRDLYGRRKDGGQVPVEIGLNPLASDEGLMVLASVIDITERKKTETVMRERVRVAEFTADIGDALATESELRAMLQKCAGAAVRHLDAAFARIWLLNASENVLELQASAGLYTHIDGGHGRVPVGQFKIGLIALERRPHLTNSVVGDPRVNDQEWAKREGMVGFAGYPLLVDGRLVGVLAMFTRRPIPTTIFQAMASGANEIAVGIERKIAEERAREHFNRIRALHDIDRAITSTLDIQSVLAVILDSVAQYFPRAAAVGIALRDHGTAALEPVACRGMVFDEWKRAFFPGDSFVKTAVDAPLVIADLRTDQHQRPAQREFIEKYGHVSLLTVPIQIADRILGSMSFATIIQYDFSSNEIDFLSTLAGQAAVAIQNADLYEQTRKQAAALAEQEHIQRVLKELGQDITKMDVNALLEKLTSTIREVFKVDISDVRFLGEGKWSNIMVATANLVQRLPGGAVSAGATDWVVKNRKAIAIDDYLERKEFTRGRVTSMFGVRGFLAAPLLSKSGEVMGVIRALSKEPRKFTAREIDLFEQLANGAAIAVENEQLYLDLANPTTSNPSS